MWGPAVKIETPSRVARIKILNKTARRWNITLGKAVASYLAEQLKPDARALEGAVLQLIAHSSLKQTIIDLNLAKILFPSGL